MNIDDQEGPATWGDDQIGLSFEARTADTGFEVVDPIERHRYALGTPEAVDPVPVSTDQFWFPVDEAVSLTTSRLTLPTVVLVYVRDEDGSVLAETEHFAYQELPPGSYSLELCAPIKLYLRVEGAVTVAADTEQTRIEFGEETDVLVGARSHHKHPAATITTTDDPVDMMAAVSTFGSALKTTSAERSYPTLRGHPPMVELGDELDVPAGLEPPETGIRIELPPERAAVYVAAPLAYYLGATVVPGQTPRIVTDSGFEYALDTPLGFEREVERVLKQTFFLDCLTRTEGFYQVDLHEREAISSVVDLDFAALYDASPAEQLETYLDVPFEMLSDHLPEWKLTTHVAPTAESVEMLPFVVDDLAVVRTPQSQAVSGAEMQVAAIDEFLRDTVPGSDGAAEGALPDGEFTRSSSSEPASTDTAYVQPETADSLEQAWIGEGTPVGASKVTTEAFRNRLARTQTDGDIDITVVCNDAAMEEERTTVDEIYGSRDELPFDIDIRRDLTVDELRTVLSSRTDFLHYIGHIDADGFQCADGKLDATTLDSIGVDAFLLNACQSYEQGLALIENGSIGGIVTLSDVINSGAIKIGSTVARLLNGGFPLRAALEIARGESFVGGQYIVVGDGGLAIAQSESGTPNLCEIKREDDDYLIGIKAFPSVDSGMGSLVMPFIEDNHKYFLGSGELEQFSLTRDELESFLRLEDIPVALDGKLTWSSSIDLDMI